MKILIAPNPYKECLASDVVAKAIEQGLKNAMPDLLCCTIPLSDGGEGFLDCIMHSDTLSSVGEIIRLSVTGPIGEPVMARYGLITDPKTSKKTAVIESAQASGLSLVPITQRNPLHTTSQGTGELILHALEAGAKKFLIGLGGSATCDGGIGALSALGLRFLNAQHQVLEGTGFHLAEIQHIDCAGIDSRLYEAEFILACDVNNVLVGAEGALMYAPQKGAAAQHMAHLSQGFAHYAAMLAEYTLKQVADLPGAGAAGGLAAGLYAFFNAHCVPGAQVVLEYTDFSTQLLSTDLIVTGEGQWDQQTLYGKGPLAISALAEPFKVPVIAIVGNMAQSAMMAEHSGVQALFSIAPGPRTEAACRAEAYALIVQTAYNIGKILNLGRRIGSSQ